MRNMRRRDFFSSIAQAGADLLVNNQFHGSLEGETYTFSPSNNRDSGTILVIDLNLKESLYIDNYNIINMRNWPQGKSIQFWRKLLIRHDLTDEIYVLCKKIPVSPPSFMRKASCIGQDGSFRSAGNMSLLPVLLVISPHNVQENNQHLLNGLAEGSDIFVGHADSLNIANSPALQRLHNFFSN